jgi:hypothetical protein
MAIRVAAINTYRRYSEPDGTPGEQQRRAERRTPGHDRRRAERRKPEQDALERLTAELRASFVFDATGRQD